MRGCFRVATAHRTLNHVLPAYAGMFLVGRARVFFCFSSPRVCGDVSLIFPLIFLNPSFSPRMRGCFWYETSESLTPMVLPAYAGMFPAILRGIRTLPGSPRVCGDVSLTGAHEDTAAVFSPRMRGCFWRYGAFSERS